MKSKLGSQSPAAEVHREAARSARLVYITDDRPGIRRIRAGRAFRYQLANGRRVRNTGILNRIKSLAIPPAWKDVWISPKAHGHLQATGRDARGRKQYRYHAKWRSTRDENKFDRLLEFGQALSRIRRRVARDLRRRGLPREKVLATIVRLLDTTLIRVGNEEYSRDNGSFGLTTLRNRHASLSGNSVRFEFAGKSGQHHAIEVNDDRLSRIVRRCRDLPGQSLFQYRDSEGRRHPVTSTDVNDYLREIGGGDFTAKHFRTWAGTVLAAECLSRQAARKARSRNAQIRSAIETVARRLGNTPTVCRKCYVHPLVLETFMSNKLRRSARAREVNSAQLRAAERGVLRLLQIQQAA
jgi:DNA topoisomerase-1